MIELGAKFILDTNKANTVQTFDFIPDIKVPVESPVLDKDGNPKKGKDGKPETVTEFRKNTELGKENGIWLRLKYLTCEQKKNLEFRLKYGEQGVSAMPMVDAFKASVIEVHGLTQKGVECKPDDILNAVGSDLADALVAEVYQAVTKNGSLTEEERKN